MIDKQRIRSILQQFDNNDNAALAASVYINICQGVFDGRGTQTSIVINMVRKTFVEIVGHTNMNEDDLAIAINDFYITVNMNRIVGMNIAVNNAILADKEVQKRINQQCAKVYNLTPFKGDYYFQTLSNLIDGTQGAL